MRQRILGKTDLYVSELAFGGLFTSSLGPGFDESSVAVHKALELGINYFDTAPGYANSEEVLGKILRGIKTPTILSTKLGGRPKPFDPRNAAQLRASVQESLRLLHRDVIDILFVHEPDRPQQYDWWSDPDAVHGPVIDVLDELKKAGVIRYTGIGGTTTAEMAHLIRSNRFDVVLSAFNYSALFREATHEVLPEALARNMGIVLGSVLQQGGLGHRYDDVVRAKPMWLSKPRQVQLLAFYRFLDEIGMPIDELCLRFAISDLSLAGRASDGSRTPSLARPANHAGPCILIGPKTAKQVEDSVKAIDKGPLPADILQRLDEIAALVPFRPFEEPMILPLSRPHEYHGPGMANVGTGAKVGRLV